MGMQKISIRYVKLMHLKGRSYSPRAGERVCRQQRSILELSFRFGLCEWIIGICPELVFSSMLRNTVLLKTGNLLKSYLFLTHTVSWDHINPRPPETPPAKHPTTDTT